MSADARSTTIAETISREGRNVEYPQKNGRPQWISEIFGQNVFSLKEMSKRLPKPIYSTFLKQIRGNEIIDKTTADAIAHAVKVWAMERGATHFTHWFQPQTDSTAEKHDSFLTLKCTFRGGYEETTALDTFSGSQLLQSEPDASSFPSGGMRSTFEARGYTVWDTKSPMFLQEGPHGTSILYVPSVFISYNGEALDEKTVLLRSSEVLAKATMELLDMLGPKSEDEERVKHVHTTLGTEQEYFLIDRGLYSLRPDLKITGRTLLGGLPPRHQQLEDHYFGKIPTRILACMSECEMELYKLGVPVKTRHNEVAPAQFELAPIFEEAMIAVDHNLITMDVLHRVAHRHKLKVLFHEKPFKGVNGSGKHCNWSMSTDTGENLLEPTAHPETNYRFLLFLVSILKALADHGGLLRAGIASASNEHRLGAHEAPPGIISAFMGDHLDDVLNSIEEDRPLKVFGSSQFHSVRVGGTVLDLKVASLPNIARDLTDRNRTSPFAFTGNKFEFRAVGSKQSVSFPMTLLNSAVASSLHSVTADLKKQKGDKKFASDDDMRAVIKKYIKETKKVRFEGDNYSDSWVQEAKKRGLPNIDNCPDAFAQLQEKRNSSMLHELGVFSESELHSRYHILMEKYAKDIQIEAETLRTMLVQHILPCAFNYRRELAEGANLLKTAGSDSTPELNALKEISPIVANIQTAVGKLEAALDEFIKIEDIAQLAKAAHDSLAVHMEEARSHADVLERLIANKHWPFPKYSELFLNI
ncbi:hypothetical protein K450DRAFT_226904 [Umbelopsis ramanniana AG]|uniref:Glutamine synthetase n=1 Tax=Umbelopsis ramanniana AG TaxID=1314678 RepID=A0AAD5EG44_UMBRA|nr:uncharacterized protein K450DRAFT_226904 [Umbelopsis ramanniana AG]KAI8582787.1 hypothetical protein K450DRAFT_226904 [Umbelopsis ramanniana AG]